MKSRLNIYYYPQTLETNTGSSTTAVGSIIDRFDYIVGYDGKKLPGVLHDHWFKGIQYQSWLGEFRQVGTVGGPYEGGYFNVLGALGQSTASLNDTTDSLVAYNVALGRLQDKISANVDLSVDTWQWKQTVKLAQDIWALVGHIRKFRPKDLANSYNQYQSARRRRAPKTFKGKQPKKDWRKVGRNVGNTWLAFSYGARPLMQDVYDTLKAMHAPKRQIIRIQSFGSDRTDRTYVDDHYQQAFYGNWHYVGKAQNSRKCRFVCDYVISESFVDTLKRFTTMDPSRFLWENIPYSFVFDWVLNFGEYLKLSEQAENSRRSFAGGVLTQMYRGYVSATITAAEFDSALERSGKGTSWRLETQKVRNVLVVNPAPVLPKVNVDFSSPWRAMNAISLLLIQFKSNS